jgi:hypothetical protein
MECADVKDSTHMSVGPQIGMGTLSQPIQRHRLEDGVNRRVDIRPVQELFSNP